MQDQNDQKNDFEDLDFDDDLLDQDFDDTAMTEEQSFEDLDDDDWNEKSNTSKMEANRSLKSSSSKSSSKLLLPALAGIVLLGGGGYFYITQMNAPSIIDQEAQDAYLLAQQESEISLTPIESDLDSDLPTQDSDHNDLLANPEMLKEDIVPYLDTASPEIDLADQPLTPFPTQPIQDIEDQSSDILPLEDIGLNEILLSEAESAESSVQNIELDILTEESSAELELSLSLDTAAPAPVDPMVDLLDTQTQAATENAQDDSLSDNGFTNVTIEESLGQPDNEMLELQEQISSLERSLSSKDSAIAQLNEQIRALQEQIESQAVVISEKENKVANLEKEVQARTHSTDSASLSAGMPSSPIPSASETATSNANIAAPLASVAPKPSTAPQQARQAATQSQTSSATISSASWQLRSAQPGKAYVARVNSSDVIMVEVGSTLSGIGRITEISNATGRWVVKGTNGQINQ